MKALIKQFRNTQHCRCTVANIATVTFFLAALAIAIGIFDHRTLILLLGVTTFLAALIPWEDSIVCRKPVQR